MRGIKIVSIICWVVIAITVLGIVGWFVTGTVFGIRPAWIDRNMPFRTGFGGTEILAGPFNTVGNESFSPSGIDSLHIDWISGGITINPHGGNNIEVRELAQRALHDDERFFTRISGTALEISFLAPAIRARIGRMPPKRLEVMVPYELAASLSSLTVDSTSASVDIDGLVADGFNITTVDVGSTSGSVSLSNISAYEIDAGSTSGSIRITSVAAGELSTDSTSGSVTVRETRLTELDIDSTSGAVNVIDTSAATIDINSSSGAVSAAGAFDSASVRTTSGAINIDNSAVLSFLSTRSSSGAMNLSGTFYNISADSTSGAVNIRSIIVPASVRVQTSSGNVNLSIPNEGAVTVSHTSSSGRFNNQIPVISETHGAQFTFTTTSGNVNIRELGFPRQPEWTAPTTSSGNAYGNSDSADSAGSS